MGMFDDRLENIVGYYLTEEGMEALSKGCYISKTNDMMINPFIEDLVLIVTSLAGALYRNANIEPYVEALQTSNFGPRMRKAIYDIFRELSRASHIYLVPELCKIKSAHFGRDMRQPIYDALIKLGANEDLYVQTVAEDYIYSVDTNSVSLVLYKGPTWPYIITPDTIENLPVTAISEFCFDSNNTLMGVRMPSGVISI